MAKIAVIGFGPGGATAAIKLAEAGHSVDIYEKRAADKVGHPWYDDIRFDIFEFCSLPAPKREIYTNKGKRLFISPDEKNSLKVPSAKPFEEISIDRRPLALYFDGLCREAGCSIFYETAVEKLITENEKVTGIITGGAGKSYDLVIDSSGLHSPFRAQVPAKFGVQSQPGPQDIMYCVRAFYERVPGTQAPDPDRNLYIKHRNGVGLSWCNLNDRNQVDIFVGRIGKLTQEEIKLSFEALHNHHDFFGYDEILAPTPAEISLRRPLSMMVADGYAAIGESAFMTMPMMGSGIEAAMKAAIWLTQTIAENGGFTVENLWDYQVKYYTNLGAKYTFIDVIKRWVLNIDVNMLNWLFGCGAVTNEDMGLVSTSEDNPNKLTAGKIAKKALIIMKRPKIIAESGKWLLKGVSAKKTAAAIPQTYDEKKVAAWRRKFDGKKVFEI